MCHRLWAGATSQAGACPGPAECPSQSSSPVLGGLPGYGTGAMDQTSSHSCCVLGLCWASALITAGQVSAGQERSSSFLSLWQDKGAGVPMGDSGRQSLAAGACSGPGVLSSWNVPSHMKELFMGSGKRQKACDISRCHSAAEVSEWMREGVSALPRRCEQCAGFCRATERKCNICCRVRSQHVPRESCHHSVQCRAWAECLN